MTRTTVDSSPTDKICESIQRFNRTNICSAPVQSHNNNESSKWQMEIIYWVVRPCGRCIGPERTSHSLRLISSAIFRFFSRCQYIKLKTATNFPSLSLISIIQCYCWPVWAVHHHHYDETRTRRRKINDDFWEFGYCTKIEPKWIAMQCCNEKRKRLEGEKRREKKKITK